MTDTSHRTTAERQAAKRADVRAGSKRGKTSAVAYYLLHHWLPRGLRK